MGIKNLKVVGKKADYIKKMETIIERKIVSIKKNKKLSEEFIATKKDE